MHEDRISVPVSHVDTPHDRSGETLHYQALEDARNGRRRAPKRPAPPPKPPVSPRGVPKPVVDADTVRGTRLDVTV
jgi:hypothetical protein